MKELEPTCDRAILDEGRGIQDEEQWAQNVQGYMTMRGLPKPGSMSEAVPILFQLKQWCEKKWVSMTDFKSGMTSRKGDGSPETPHLTWVLL